MDPIERRVAQEKLHTIGVLGHVGAHELYRVFKTHKAGLSEKEQAYLDKVHRDYTDVLERITKVANRCKA